MQRVKANLSARTVRLLDLAVVIWIVVWIAAGAFVWYEVRMQAALSADVISMGVSVRGMGDAFGALGDLPFFGGELSAAAGQLTAAGAELETIGRDSYDGIMRAAGIVGVGVGALPIAIILFIYLPLRISWHRDVSAVAAAVRASSGAPGLEAYLAHRALATLRWDSVQAITPDPVGALAAGDVEWLADAELDRLGIRRPRLE